MTAACSPAKPAGPYAARYAEAISQATTDFERDVLADGTITRAEYEEANNRYVTCMADAGFPLTLLDQEGYYVYSMSAAPGVDEASTRCSSGTAELISGIYVEQITNPNNEDVNAITVACFVRAGLVEQSYTTDQLKADLENETLPFDDSAPAFNTCMANPSSDLTAP